MQIRIRNAFYLESVEMCSARDLIISDTLLLPDSTFTHVNNGTLSRSWLDHCVSSPSMHGAITNILVDENYTGSDHFPMHVTFNLRNLPNGSGFCDDEREKINWNFNDANLNTIFYNVLWHRLEFDPKHPGLSCRSGCDNIHHLLYLDSLWAKFVQTAQEVGREVFGVVKTRNRCIPGWNDFVRDYYTTSREAFKTWKENGSPRFGPMACLMRRSRAEFKYVLRQCRLQEDELRAMALSNKLQDNDFIPFWRDVQSLRGSDRLNLPKRIDDAIGSEAIADLWKNKFSNVLSCLDDQASMNEYFAKIVGRIIAPVLGVTMSEIKNIVKSLANNKAVGLDDIPNEFYKCAPQKFLLF